MDRARYTELFLNEGREHLTTCSQLLVQLEQAPKELEPVHGLFRAVHTLKGMAATMGYSQVTDLSHRMESVLDQVRRGDRRVSAELIDALLDTVDALESGIESAALGHDAELDFREVLAPLLPTEPRKRVRKRAPEKGLPPARKPKPSTAQLAVQVVIDPRSPMRGARAALILENIRALGRVSGVEPPSSELERDVFAGEFSFQLATDASAEVAAESVRKVGDVHAVSCEPVARSTPAATGARAGAVASPTVRVDLRRLDTLMNQVGELVVARNRLTALIPPGGDGEVVAIVAKIGRLVTEFQAEVILARMTPVAEVFERFPRAVRDLARVVGKEVSLEVEGSHIEVDRSILDQIGEPLLHLLRNAVDHGIEPPQARSEAGKPRMGQLSLVASRERNSVVFRVTDDGRGIDRAAILQKAKRDGVVAESAEGLADEQLLDVLGRAGFSTAEKVTSVSGRGVGVDVVLTRIRSLGGSVEIQSEAGRGTAVILRLPLTVVLLRALLARAGEERYVVPVTYVAETVYVDGRSLTELNGREAVVLRDEVIPTVRLRELVGLNGNVRAATRQPCVVLEVGTRRVALVVDALLGQEEIVVEPFDPPSGTPAVFSGATILSDGVPSLIIDAAAIT
ncbi:MAG: chemotaxis protein CheA [Gemmatimonadales bacterium]|nr:chemotaxis protein CheA [Gemmatimonadales bacterium]